MCVDRLVNRTVQIRVLRRIFISICLPTAEAESFLIGVSTLYIPIVAFNAIGFVVIVFVVIAVLHAVAVIAVVAVVA